MGLIFTSHLTNGLQARFTLKGLGRVYFLGEGMVYCLVVYVNVGHRQTLKLKIRWPNYYRFT